MSRGCEMQATESEISGVEVVTVCNTATDALLVKASLEARGIEAFLEDYHVVGLNPLYNIVMGGVKVQVRRADLEQAQEILEAPDSPGGANLAAIATGEPGSVFDSEWSSAPDHDDGLRCPRCGSMDVGYRKLPLWVSVALGLPLAIPYMLYLVLARPKRECHACEHRWKQRTA